jgi:hypothetical protein
MTRDANIGPFQFRLRSVLAAITWLALVLAVCVQHQRTSTRQREIKEQLISVGIPPLGPMTSSSRNGPRRKGFPGKRPTRMPSDLDPAGLDVDVEFSPLPST